MHSLILAFLPGGRCRPIDFSVVSLCVFATHATVGSDLMRWVAKKLIICVFDDQLMKEFVISTK